MNKKPTYFLFFPFLLNHLHFSGVMAIDRCGIHNQGGSIMHAQTAPWHKSSFDTFIHEHLPELLESRMPLASISIESNDTYTFRMKLGLTSDTVDGIR